MGYSAMRVIVSLLLANTSLQKATTSSLTNMSSALLSSSFCSCSHLPSTASSKSPSALPLYRPRRVTVRASSSPIPPSDDNNVNRNIGGLNTVIDKATKKEITKEDVLRHQEQDDSEKKSVFGAVPKSGSFYPRPEVERRPETGDKSFGSLMAFDGAGPETINGRLAMVGIVWAFLAERATGLTVAEQLFASGGSGLFNFLAVVQLLWYASLVPMFRGESPDSRQLGPFRAMAERWNGRTAMIGFLSLVITEAFTKSPVFHWMM